jgi:hypothetical protein
MDSKEDFKKRYLLNNDLTNLRDILVIWFINNEPRLYKKMLKSKHYAKRNIPNPFHGEGSIWTHTMMVMTWITNKYFNLFKQQNHLYYQDKEKFIILLISALLHDIGKVFVETRMEEEELKPLRNSFKGHEGVSFFKAIEILEKIKEDFPILFELYNSNKDIYYMQKMILTIVGTHGMAIQTEDKYIKKIKEEFREADKFGAIRSVDEDIFSQYDKQNFASSKHIEKESEKELVFVVGLPCSGKTKFINTNFPNHSIISRDEAMLEFYNIENNTNYPESDNIVYFFINDPIDVEKQKLKKFNAFFEEKILEYKDKEKIAIDMTMLSLSSRRKFLNVFNKHNRKCFLLIPNEKIIKERNNKRKKDVYSKYISKERLLKSKRRFSMPLIEEGFEEIVFIF